MFDWERHLNQLLQFVALCFDIFKKGVNSLPKWISAVCCEPQTNVKKKVVWHFLKRLAMINLNMSRHQCQRWTKIKNAFLWCLEKWEICIVLIHWARLLEMVASECQQSKVGNKTKGLKEISQTNEGDCCDCLLMIMEKAMRGKFKKMIMLWKNCTQRIKKKGVRQCKKRKLTFFFRKWLCFVKGDEHFPLMGN